MTEDEFVEEDLYNEQGREVQLEEDEIDAEEEGFIRGFDETKNQDEDIANLDDDERMSD